MLNEWKEFQDYTGVVNYTAWNKQDTTYLGRFTFDTILDFEGLNRVLTILPRGFLFHNENSSPVKAPRERIDYSPSFDKSIIQTNASYKPDFKDSCARILPLPLPCR